MKLIYPVLAQMLWTFAVILMAARARVGSVKAREVTLGQIALSGEAWPDRIRAFGNNMNNQFETPTLFYALAGVAIFVGATGWGMAMLAWGYVATRVVHTLIQTGGNDVLSRFRAFAAGVFLLMALWAGVVLKLIGVV